MKKILRLVTTSVLTLTLVACGEAASSSVNTGGTTTTGTGTVSSAYANVTSVTLSAASNTLTQVAGALQRVTVTAALNANTNPTLTLEWFVDGVKSSQTGRSFEFTPNKGGTFAIQARVGSLSSNVLNVVVGQAAISSAAFVDANTLEVVAPGGATVTVAGQTVADTSFYDLKNGKYVIDLEDALVQGTEVTVSLARVGFEPLTQKVIYDTREFKLSKVTLTEPMGSKELSPTAGVYRLVKPYDVGAIYNKKYSISFETKNVVAKDGNVEYKVETTVPTGALAVATTSELVSAAGNREFTVTSETVVGLYTHKITFGGKVVEVKIEVLNSLPEIEVLTSKRWNSLLGAYENYEIQYGKDSNDDPAALAFGGNIVTYVNLSSDGVYEITKPFVTENTTLYGFSFDVISRNFLKSDFLKNQYSVSVVGPTSFSATNNTLFQGIETKTPGTPNSAVMTALQAKDFNGQPDLTNGANGTSTKFTVHQFIDSGTPLGEYTFKVSAGAQGAQISKDVKVRILAPTPKLDFNVLSFESIDDGTQTREQVVQTLSDGTIVLDKPATSTSSYTLKWFTLLQNYQSVLLGANDFAETTADSLLTNLDQRKLFSISTGIKDNSVAYPAADLLVKRNVVEQVVKARLVKTSADAITITPNSAVTGITLKTPAGSTSAAYTVPNSTGAIGTVYDVIIGTVSTDINVGLGVTNHFDITEAALEKLDADDTSLPAITVEGSEDEFYIEVSDYPDVLEFGRGFAAAAPAIYKFVDVGFAVTGPSKLMENVPTTRSAILLGANKNGLILFNGTGGGLTQANIRTAIGDTVSQKYLQDEAFANGLGNYTSDLFDLFGFNRSALTINNLTVEGTYTLKFQVDNLIEEVKIQIRTAQPKVFLMSGWTDANSDNIIDENEGNLGGTKYSTSLNLLKFFDSDYSSPTEAGMAEEAGDTVKYAVGNNGVYTIQMPDSLTNHGLYSKIGVVDLPVGTYPYSIRKEYPDGRVVSLANNVRVVSVNDNQEAEFTTDATTAAFAAANTIFTTNWKIFEPTLEKGTYKYSFTISNTTLNITVNVIDPPSFVFNLLTVNGEEATLFNKIYRALLADFTGDVKAVVGLDNLKNGIYFTLHSTESVAAFEMLDVLTSNPFALPTSTDAEKIARNTAMANALELVDEIRNLDLGEISVLAGQSLADANSVQFVISFYEPVRKVNELDLGFKLIYTQTITLRIDA